MDSSSFAPGIKLGLALAFFAAAVPLVLMFIWTDSSELVQRNVAREIGFVLGVALFILVALRIMNRWVDVDALTMYGGPVIVGLAHALVLWWIYRGEVETVKQFRISYVQACTAARGKAVERYCECAAQQMAFALTVKELRELTSRPEYGAQPRIKALTARCA
jgi:hypothetical protein